MTEKDTIYVTPWYECNLHCPHCEVSKRKIEYQEGKFLSTLKTLEAKNFVLFGGEPTLHLDKFQKILETKKINSVSSNIVVHNTELTKTLIAPLFQEYNVSLATSWNYTRFSKKQVNLWLDNLWHFYANRVDILILITLTEDLIRDGMNSVLEVLWVLETMGINKFLFEPYIGEKEIHKEADEWLCKFHDMYTGGMRNLLEEKLDNWKCSCNNVFTLNPDGVLYKGCPDSLDKTLSVCEECLICNLVDKCQPCMLQSHCSYPKKLEEKLRNGR